MNSKISKTSDTHRLLFSLTDKIDLRRKDRYIALSIPSIYYAWKNIKKSYKNNEFKIQHGMKNFKYLMDHSDIYHTSSISDIQDFSRYV